MRDLNPRADRRLSSIESDVRDRFEADITRHHVGLNVAESDRLQHLLNVTENAYQLQDRADSVASFNDEIQQAAFSAAENLDDCVDTVVDNLIAHLCFEIVDEADRFTDRNTTEEVQAAVDEAHEWLTEHENVVERNDLEIPDPEVSPSEAV
jgi:hypothetical protein